MGFNTSMMILNDHLSSIAADKDFGERVASAAYQMGGSPTKPIEIRGGLLIETHHADHCVPILVGANSGWLVERCFVRWNTADPEQQLLEALAKKKGFVLTPIKKA